MSAMSAHWSASHHSGLGGRSQREGGWLLSHLWVDGAKLAKTGNESRKRGERLRFVIAPETETASDSQRRVDIPV